MAAARRRVRRVFVFVCRGMGDSFGWSLGGDYGGWGWEVNGGSREGSAFFWMSTWKVEYTWEMLPMTPDMDVLDKMVLAVERVQAID